MLTTPESSVLPLKTQIQTIFPRMLGLSLSSIWAKNNPYQNEQTLLSTQYLISKSLFIIYMKFKIPDRFIDRYKDIVDDSDAFIQSIHTYLPKTFRINTIKADRKILLERFASYGFNLNCAPWYEDAFTVDSLEIGSTLEHFLGWIYIQEFTSMTPPLLVKEELNDANFILDGCAAPGSKTTQIAAIKENKGTIVANDKDFGRIRALRFNLEKLGF